MQVGTEVFSIDNCDSFEEAIGKVEKGVYDRKIQKEAKEKKAKEEEENKRKSEVVQSLMEEGEDADKAIKLAEDSKPVDLPVVKPTPPRGYFGRGK